MSSRLLPIGSSAVVAMQLAFSVPIGGHDDLEQVKGKRTELCGRLQQKYGYARDQAEREVDNWLKSTP
jgi:hypothetical protein